MDWRLASGTRRFCAVTVPCTIPCCDPLAGLRMPALKAKASDYASPATAARASSVTSSHSSTQQPPAFTSHHSPAPALSSPPVFRGPVALNPATGKQASFTAPPQPSRKVVNDDDDAFPDPFSPANAALPMLDPFDLLDSGAPVPSTAQQPHDIKPIPLPDLPSTYAASAPSVAKPAPLTVPVPQSSLLHELPLGGHSKPAVAAAISKPVFVVCCA